METSFQLSILFTSPYTVRVKAYHLEHFGKTCGLCGTCTANREDDLQLPNGELVCLQSLLLLSMMVLYEWYHYMVVMYSVWLEL